MGLFVDEKKIAQGIKVVRPVAIRALLLAQQLGSQIGSMLPKHELMENMMYEYKLLDAGDMEFGSLRKTLAELAEAGWTVDGAWGSELPHPYGPASLQIWLRRERRIFAA